MKCTECGGSEFTPHMTWAESRFVGGNVRCASCGNIQSETPEPAPTPRARRATADAPEATA
jgi:uncharacterized Zn finger protein